IPRGARCRKGALAIDYDEQTYRARIATEAVPTTPPEDGPWGNQKPDYYYPYFGDPIRGSVQLEPQAPQIAVRCSSEIRVASGRAALLAHVQLQPRVGSADQVQILVSAPPAGRWVWKPVQGNNTIRAFEPLSGVEAAAASLMGVGSPAAHLLSVPV